MKLIPLFFLLIAVFNLAQTPILLKDVNPNGPDIGFSYGMKSEITLVNDTFYFSGIRNSQDYNKHAVYRSDGTPNGTSMVFGLEDFSMNTEKFKQVGDLVFFVANAPFITEELWVTDGTEDGTYLVKDINADSFSRPFALMEYNDKLYFWANDGIHGEELWTSDGTEEGTYMVKDINSLPGQSQGSASEYDFEHHPPVIYNDLMYFNVKDASSGKNLWVSDGTEAGTSMFFDFIAVSELMVYDDKLYFSSDGIAGQNSTSGLWVTDGTVEGTSLLKYFNGGVQDLYMSNGKLFFYGSYAELWVTDGTSSGTQMVKDINPSGQSYWYPSDRPGLAPTMAEFNDKLYFTAVHDSFGAELWVTDGTEAGTEMVIDIDEDNGVGPTTNYSGPYNLTVMNDKLYFTTSNDAYGHQLWVTEGTAETTQIIIPENPKVDALRHTDKLVVLNDKLYFPAYYSDAELPSIYYFGENMGLNEINNVSDLLIYPNPVNDWLYFSEPMNQIEVFSITGELMLKFDNEKEINMGNLKKGIYLVKARSQNGITKTSKIMKN